ncbi:MAG: hypothetical protein V3V78_01140 [Candidatus Woesearchaeota archaeon]
MTSLIASVGSGKGTWSHLQQVIEKQEWDNVYLITDEFGKENFKPNKQVEFIMINSNSILENLVEDIKQQLQNKILDTEVAINLISGTGKEHMAILSAVLKLGLGIRQMALTPDGIKEI